MTMLFAQSINRNVPDTSSAAIFYAAIAVCAALLFFSFVVLIVKRYRRCPSNRVLVIYGKAGGGKAVKCLHGGATFVWPLIQDHAYLSLEPIPARKPPPFQQRDPPLRLARKESSFKRWKGWETQNRRA